ncbi:hypothetical protein H4W33_001400 [Kibdelosporangium phytohabitans]|nr:hypothetical protein [Kibdelosporangium phytohabitans]
MALYTEGRAGAAHIEDPEKVREAKLVFDRLQTEALTPSAATALVTSSLA